MCCGVYFSVAFSVVRWEDNFFGSLYVILLDLMMITSYAYFGSCFRLSSCLNYGLLHPHRQKSRGEGINIEFRSRQIDLFYDSFPCLLTNIVFAVLYRAGPCSRRYIIRLTLIVLDLMMTAPCLFWRLCRRSSILNIFIL
mmetsp:Transcript_13024/g.28133  ORF Transcript_13024/g.28133 Transcript_13024/m.28133 type:complete len:140 (+) Transcript_13024:498-917(+)